MSGQINLYNPALRRHIDPLGAASVAAGTVLLLIAVGALAVWAGMEAQQTEARARDMAAQLKDAKDQLSALQQRASRKPDPALAAEVVAAQALVGARREILAMLGSGAGVSRGFAEYFKGLARQAPNGLWLVEFAIGAGGVEMEIRGRTLNAALLPEYIRRLNGESAFKGRAFASLTIEQKQEGQQAGGKTAALAGPRFIEFTLEPVRAAIHGKGEDAKAGKGEEVNLGGGASLRLAPGKGEEPISGEGKKS